VTPRHHPDELLLFDYAAGALAIGSRLVVETHLGTCAVCRREVAGIEAIGGAMLSDLPPAALLPDALSLALARIERPAPGMVSPASPVGWIAVPAEVAAAAAHRRWAAPGVWVSPINRARRGPRSYLLGVGAGIGVPRHTHKGDEMVCVLKGAFIDGDARFEPGDFVLSDETVDHRPRITDDGECVCLISADSALVARDWIGRLFQPLVGI
jgi:putative transcriptional regulator